MKNLSISSRYAKVLFHLDRKNKHLELRLKDFESILNIFNSNPKLIKFLKAPQVSLKNKQNVIENIFKEEFDLTFINFLSYLIQKERLLYLKLIHKEYRHLVNEYLGRWEADLITASPIDSENETKLVKKLENVFHKKIHLSKKIDPQIIGGAILIIENKMLDWSVKGRLKKLKENLISTQV